MIIEKQNETFSVGTSIFYKSIICSLKFFADFKDVKFETKTFFMWFKKKIQIVYSHIKCFDFTDFLLILLNIFNRRFTKKIHFLNQSNINSYKHSMLFKCKSIWWSLRSPLFPIVLYWPSLLSFIIFGLVRIY